MSGLVTLTTDFGLRDGYAAALEAAVLRVDPGVRVVHVSHQVPPGDIATGAYLLEYASRSFPDGTVHLGVVDPGVGSGRRILAVSGEAFVVVGPDNGVLRRALRGIQVTAVDLPRDPDPDAPTFESRDVMAPAAARLASGASINDLGPSVAVEPVPPAPMLSPGTVQRTSVAHVDGFGTVVLDIRCQPGPGGVRLDERHRVKLAKTFSDVGPGELVAYRGSIGYLEVAVRDGSAAEKLGLRMGSDLGVELLR